MNAILDPETVQHRIQTTRRMSPAQAKFVTDLVNARYTPEDEAGRQIWRSRWNSVSHNRHVSALIEDLKKVPTLIGVDREAQAEELRVEQAQRTAERETADEARRVEDKRRQDIRPTKEGFYRNPETGELFRISISGWDTVVSKYTRTGGPRRLVRETGEVVKGKFERWTAFNSRLALAQGKIDKAWEIDATTLARDYAYGFCPLHNGPLTDGVSVVLGYGRTCAEREGLPWGEEAMQAVLDARKAV